MVSFGGKLGSFLGGAPRYGGIFGAGAGGNGGPEMVGSSGTMVHT